MSKEKQTEVNPFSNFTVLKGEFVAPENESDITTGNETVLEDLDGLEAERIAAGNAALEKQIAKTTKVKKSEIAEEVEETNETEEEVEDTDTTGIKEFTESLYKKGVIDFDSTDEAFINSEEGIETLINKTVENRINNWSNNLPDDYHKFLEFVEAGGKPKEFLDVYYGNNSWEDFNLASDDNQKTAVRESLRLAGEDPNDIEEIVTEWYDNGTLEKRAKSAISKLQKYEAAKKAEIVEITKQKELQRQADERKQFESFKQELYSKDEIKGFKITEKQKDKLWNFMTAVDRTGKTGYDKALETNKDAAYLFALQAMNNFDITKLEKQVETKVVKGINKIFKNYSTSSKQGISSGTTEEIEENNPFAGFKKAY